MSTMVTNEVLMGGGQGLVRARADMCYAHRYRVRARGVNIVRS